MPEAQLAFYLLPVSGLFSLLAVDVGYVPGYYEGDTTCDGGVSFENTRPKDKNIVIIQLNKNGIRNKIEEPHYNTVDTDIAYCIRHVTN